MRRAWLVLAIVSLLPSTAWAQDTDTSPEEAESAPEPVLREAAPEPSSRPAPKVVLVVVGDPDQLVQDAVTTVERRIVEDGTLRLPADTALRDALRGDAGTADDGLEEVRRERGRLGLGDATDAPILQRLGRRAGAVLVVAVRESATGVEATALDVESGRFFEGGRSLAEPGADAVLAFVRRRAQVSVRSASEPAADQPVASGELPAVTVPVAATEVTEPAPERDWFEQHWPYLAAGVLLAGAIVFVVVAATDGDDSQPMLRFQPGAP